MSQLPTHIGGYQHLEPWVVAKADDILVDQAPLQFVASLAGMRVGEIESLDAGRVYRSMPVAKQGDNDDCGWKKVRESADHEMRVEESRGPLPTDAKARKATPIYSGVIRYFPRAIAAVAHLSMVGNEQHNPGQPLHWDRSKSGDELDALMRHLMEADEIDKDGIPHVVKVAWRAMAAAEKYLEKQENK